MKLYTHNGKDVIFQFVSRPFIEQLNDVGIYPEELPDLTNLIYKYTKDDVTRYAVIVSLDGMEEKVYITYYVPEDGFTALVQDIENQRQGEPPAKTTTRYALACQDAYKKSIEYIREKYKHEYDDWFFTGIPEDVEEERKSVERSCMLCYGYDDEYLKKIKM